MCFVATGVWTMAQGHKFQDLEETGEAFVAFINSSQPEKLRQVKDEYQALFDQHIETKTFVTQILRGKNFTLSFSAISVSHFRFHFHNKDQFACIWSFSLVLCIVK